MRNEKVSGLGHIGRLSGSLEAVVGGLRARERLMLTAPSLFLNHYFLITNH